MESKKIILVTGATRGIGMALSTEFAKRGHIVFGGGRSWPKEPGNTAFTPIALDVTVDESVKSAVNRIVGEHGRIDALVNNAGISQCGPLEETSIDNARGVFETNYFGVMRMTQAVLPAMRSQGSGAIVLVGSAAGKIALPYQAQYSGSKFAIEGLAESLWYEMKQFGIRVILIEPGDIATGIWERVKANVPDASPYRNAMDIFLDIKKKEMESPGAAPEDAAIQIADIVLGQSTSLRHPITKSAARFLMLRKVLPDSIFLKAVARNYKIKCKE